MGIIAQMAGTGSSAPADKNGRRRPAPATLDLRAAEVPTDGQDPAPLAPAAPEAPSSARSETAGAPEGQAGKGNLGSRLHRTFSFAPIMPHWSRRDVPWPYVAAGAAGGAFAVLFVLALWLIGLLPAGDDSAALALRLSVVESQLRTVADRRPAIDARQLAELVTRIDAVEQAVRRIDDLSARLALNEQALRRIDDVAARMTRAEAALAAQPASEAGLTQRLGTIDASVKSLSERLDGAARRLDEIAATRAADERAAAAKAATLAPQANLVDDRAARFAFVATALRSAVDRGEPFAPELAALNVLVSDPAVLSSLEKQAGEGVPSAATLARELVSLVPKLQATAAPPRHDSGLFARLALNAERLVRVRPINEAPGDDLPAIVGRIEVKAARADIAGALVELAKLPASARSIAEPWMARAQARLDALALVQRLTADAFSALGKGP